MGNSEVGHTNIGAGRVVWMDLPRIDNAIADGSFAANEALAAFIAAVKESGGTAHVAGLASPGGVHAHQRQIAAAAEVIAEAGVPVAVHAFLDGRDVPPKSALEQIAALEAALPEGARIRTVVGAVLRHGPRQALGARGRRRSRRSCMPRASMRRRPRRRSRRPTSGARPTSSCCRR